MDLAIFIWFWPLLLLPWKSDYITICRIDILLNLRFIKSPFLLNSQFVNSKNDNLTEFTIRRPNLPGLILQGLSSEPNTARLINWAQVRLAIKKPLNRLQALQGYAPEAWVKLDKVKSKTDFFGIKNAFWRIVNSKNWIFCKMLITQIVIFKAPFFET